MGCTSRGDRAERCDTQTHRALWSEWSAWWRDRPRGTALLLVKVRYGRPARAVSDHQWLVGCASCCRSIHDTLAAMPRRVTVSLMAGTQSIWACRLLTAQSRGVSRRQRKTSWAVHVITLSLPVLTTPSRIHFHFSNSLQTELHLYDWNSSIRPKIVKYLNVSTSTRSLHQKKINIISSFGSWRSKNRLKICLLFLMKTSGGSRNVQMFNYFWSYLMNFTRKVHSTKWIYSQNCIWLNSMATESRDSSAYSDFCFREPYW